MKLRLIAGTINRWNDDDVWRNYHLDIVPRTIWDPELSMGVYPDFVMDIGGGDLADFRDEMWDEIRCHHVLEHLPPDRAPVALEGFHRILRSGGGILDIEVPDLTRVATAYLNDDLDDDGAAQWLLGEQLAQHTPADSHRSIWTERKLRDALSLAGFAVPGRSETGLALRFLAAKR